LNQLDVKIPEIMKKIILIAFLSLGLVAYGQEAESKLEKVGKLVEKTVYHENGQVAQTGYLLNGKPHGQWLQYDDTGKKIAVGRYDEGVKQGRWMFWSEGSLTEVEFEKNIIKNVKKWNKSELVYVE
jgi:antitoxin component YwqK of YwqJK toxin-antitoxin module